MNVNLDLLNQQAMPTGQNKLSDNEEMRETNGHVDNTVSFLQRTRRVRNFFPDSIIFAQPSAAKRTFTLKQERAVMLARCKNHASNNRRWMNSHPDEADQILAHPEPLDQPQPDPTFNPQLSGGCLGPVLQSV